MAIPATPSNFILQTGNRENYLSWSISVGSTSYSVQRSTDGVTFSALATPSLNNYTDQAVTIGVEYFYRIAATNTDGTSPYTNPQSIVPAPTGEMSLQSLRLASQQKADRVNSPFVTVPEWNSFINLAMNELYDLLVTAYEDYFMAPPVNFQTVANQYMYPLPNGALTFQDQTGANVVAKPFYKLQGVDLSINSANNAYVTLNKFNFQNRNQYVYPNSNSTIYGVFNLQYRLLGDQIEFIPAPTSNQKIQLWYIPRLPLLLKDTDLTTIGFSGWLQYVIVRAAKYALDKEESETSALDQELIFLKKRIEETAANRDAGRPDTITDVRGTGWWGNNSGGGPNGPVGGW